MAYGKSCVAQRNPRGRADFVQELTINHVYNDGVRSSIRTDDPHLAEVKRLGIMTARDIPGAHPGAVKALRHE